MILKWLPLLMLLVSLNSFADDSLVINGGLGVFHTGDKSLSESKLLKFGLEEDLWGPLKQRFNLGLWLDNGGGGRSNGANTGYQIGFEVENHGFVASIWTGPGLISNPDVLLGSYFEFNETLYLGMKDRQGNSLGVTYNHWSDAGLTGINEGRDYIGLEIGVPFNL